MLNFNGYRRAKGVTRHDTTPVAPGFGVKAIYCGGASAENLKVTTAAGDVITFVGVPVGTIIPVAARIIWATGTGFTDADLVVLGD